MKIGDIIAAYHTGIHKITKIDGLLVYYKKLYDSNLNTCQSKEKHCHIDYISPAKEFLLNDKVELLSKLKRLENILESLK